MTPEDLHYTEEHEWVRLEEGEATIGITDYAAGELGDIVYVELPEVGREFEKGEALGTIETVKAVEEIFAPVTGRIVAVNESLADQPELMNGDPYQDGWICRLELQGEPEGLLSPAEYEDIVGSE